MTLIDYSSLATWDSDPDFQRFTAVAFRLIESNLNVGKSGDLNRWLMALKHLPDITPSRIILDNSAIVIGQANDIDAHTGHQLQQQLMQLHPWRKGPFNFFGIHIDTEWRSDWKWDRLKQHMGSLTNKRVLDVGCGSGYHCWRMRGAGAQQVVGIEPTLLFVVQFHAAQKYLLDPAVQVIPARLEELPRALQLFDITFSMGVFYHRHSPFDHLLELRDTLKPGGQLVLETLVINGKLHDVLVPEGRYGKMGNVWFIPSPSTLESWLRKTGFTNIQCIDITATTTEEQRQTEWMRFQSLRDFLDPGNYNRTIEGYPAPIRAIFKATKPE